MRRNRYFPVRSESEFEQALDAIMRGPVEGILGLADGFTMSFAEWIAAFSVAQKIPAVSGWALFVQRGHLMSYRPIINERYPRLTVHVDKIYKGAKPADLPTKVELMSNLKTAKVLGTTIPQTLLLRADEAIQ